MKNIIYSFRIVSPRSWYKLAWYFARRVASGRQLDYDDTVVLFKCKHGLKLYDYAHHWLMHIDHYEVGTTSFLLDNLSKNSILMDVGSGVGVHVLHALSRGARVIAVDPYPLNNHLLMKNIELNGFDMSKLVLVQGPVASESRLAKFNIARRQGQHTLIDIDTRIIYNTLTTTIDEIVEVTRLYPDIIKIDVEGSEIEVLRGASKTLAGAVKHVIIEADNSTENAIDEILQGYGFEKIKILDRLPNSAKKNILYSKVY